MPIPPIGNLVTPRDFVIMSAQDQVVLNWAYAPLATSYFVSRSVDNVVFDELAETTSLQYLDTTAVVGVIYYYRVQSSDGVNSSPATYSLSGQALNPGQTTVGNIRLECQQRTDRVNSDNISTQEWNSMISQSYKELYDILIQKFGDDYYVQIPFYYTTTGMIDSVTQAQTFPLPRDFYKLLRCEVALNPSDPNSWITLRQFMAVQANLWNYPNVYTFYGITNLRYRLWGTNLQIVPIASAGQTIRIWYAPKPNQLIRDTDTVDAISGYEEYIVADVCIKALAKTEEDVSVFVLQKAALLKRVEEAAENRNIGDPQTVSDARTRNFAWGDDGSFSGGGQW